MYKRQDTYIAINSDQLQGVVMKKKMLVIFCCFCFFLLELSGNIGQAEKGEDEPTNLYARSAVLLDADSGRILFGQDERRKLPMASTTKIMTCILVLEQMLSLIHI